MTSSGCLLHPLSPSVLIPNDVAGSFYQGKPCVGLKYTVTEGSTSYRQMAELPEYLPTTLNRDVPPIVCMITDGGPDHNVTISPFSLL